MHRMFLYVSSISFLIISTIQHINARDEVLKLLGEKKPARFPARLKISDDYIVFFGQSVVAIKFKKGETYKYFAVRYCTDGSKINLPKAKQRWSNMRNTYEQREKYTELVS